MKKSMRLFALLLALAVLCGMLTACGGGAGSAVAGTYEGQYTKFVGDDDDARDTTPFSLELKANGKGVHHRDDLDIDVTWTLDGENFTMVEKFMGMEMEYTGTLVDGTLDLFNGDPDDIWTCEYVYIKK